MDDRICRIRSLSSSMIRPVAAFLVAAVFVILPLHKQRAGSAVDFEPANEISAFKEWAGSFVAEPRLASIHEGERLAVPRRKLLLDLASRDPRSAIEYSVGPEVYSALPASIQKQIEKPVSFIGDFHVYAIDDEAGWRVERSVEFEGQTYKAIVYGRRLPMTAKLGIPLQGVILDDTIILDENFHRELVGDGQETAGVAAIIGGTISTFGSRAELESYVADHAEWESKIGPVRPTESSAIDSPQSSWTEGTKSLLFIRVDFPDAPGEPLNSQGQPLTIAGAQSVLTNEVAPFFAVNSLAKTALVPTVTSVVRMPQTRSYYVSGGLFNTMLSDARAAARAAGFETNNFNLDVVAFTFTSSVGWLGAGSVGGKGALLNGSFTLGTIAHELGHSYGLWHANAWRTVDGTIAGNGSHIESGDAFDTMGLGASLGSGAHFNAPYKRRLDWITANEVQTVTTTGNYRIVAHDSAVTVGIRVLKIGRTDGKNYWIEFRQLLSGSVSNGATIRWDYPSRNYRETQLLDMTPATSNVTSDAALLVGQTFIDNENGIKITVLGKAGTTPESLDVRVEFAVSTIPNHSTRFDFDGDGRSDISVARPSDNTWYLSQSQAGYMSKSFGQADDKLTGADFDGDGKTDLAVWRPSEGNWYIIHSTNGAFVVRNFGQNGDIPVPADFDGDGKADFGIYRPSEGIWYRLLSTNQYTVVQYGIAEDKPQIGDFDGDSKADLVVYRPSTGDWHIAPSGGGYWASRWGVAGDVPVPGDYNGDGKTDAAIFRPSTGEWWVLFTGTNGITTVTWGVNGDIPAPGDYDGDGKTDMAVFRPSTGQWWLYRSTEGIANPIFGQNGDRPIADPQTN